MNQPTNINRYLFILFTIFSVSTLFAQEKCKTMKRHEFLMQNDIAYKKSYDARKIKENVVNHGVKFKQTVAAAYTVPVVVHVMHKGSAVGVAENISNEQIYSAIYSINEAYRKKAGTKFFGNGVDVGIEFCLAQKDPSGNATTGINRVNMSLNTTYMAEGITDANESAIKALSKWDNTKYYNIWIVSEIDDNNAGAGTQGYAYFPGTSSTYDGAVMLFNAFGFDPDGKRGFNLKSFTNENSTFIHEMGHAFGLYHTFQGDNDGVDCPINNDPTTDGDEVDDTPPHKRSDSDCNTSGTNSCDGGSSNEEFVHNYMDYSRDDCQNEFTAGQKTKMHNEIDTYRSNLVSATNLSNCGCSGNNPVAYFYTEPSEICPSETVTIVNNSLNTPSSYNWSAINATVPSSNLTTPSFTYNSSGVNSITLTALGNSGGTSTYKVDVTVKQGENIPYVETFEGDFDLNGWENISNDVAGSESWGTNGKKQWEVRSVVGNSTSSQKSMGINFFNYNYTNTDDELISPEISLIGSSTPILNFEVAYKTYSTQSDGLKVFAKSACDETWVQIYSKSGSTLATNGSSSGIFNPASSNDWRTESVSLSAYKGKIIHLKFQAVNGYGNNLFIDDVRVVESGNTGPIANFEYTKNENVVTYKAIAFGTISNYSWSFGADAVPSTATGIGPHTVTYSSDGIKDVSLTVVGSSTSVETKSITIGEVVASNSNMVSSELFSLYPNPTNGILKIAFNENQLDKAIVEISDLTNRGYDCPQLIVGNQLELDLTDFSKGVYLVKVIVDGNIFYNRIVLQ